MKNKSVNLPGTNIFLNGWGYDVNGNKIIKLQIANDKPFTVQVLGNVMITNSIIKKSDSPSDISKTDLQAISIEIGSYIENYGTKKQKESFKKY